MIQEAICRRWPRFLLEAIVRRTQRIAEAALRCVGLTRIGVVQQQGELMPISRSR